MFARCPPRTFSVVLFATILLSGCSSGGGRIDEGQKAIEGFQSTRTGVQKAQQQVDQTLVSIDKLAAGGEMQKSYKAYTKEVDDLQGAAKNAAKRAQKMRENYKEYVTKWQKEVEKMGDPTIKASLTQRREAVSANFDRVRSSAEAAKQAYEPFMKTLQEIRNALAIDLSPQALPGLKPAMDKAKGQGQTLKQKLAAMQSDLDRIVSGMSSGTAASAAR